MSRINNILKVYRSLIISGAILLFCIIGFIFAVLPSTTKIQSLWKDTQRLSEESKSLQIKFATLNSLDEESLRQQLNTVVSAVPTDKSLPTVFSTIESLTAQSGVSLVSLSIGGATKLSTASATKQTAQETQLGTRTIPFSVTIKGTLDAIQHFITLVPQVRRLLRIRTFSISFPQENQPLSISVEMDAFYQPSPTLLGNTGSVLITLTDAEQTVIDKVSQMPLAGGSDVALPPAAIGQLKQNPFAP